MGSAVPDGVALQSYPCPLCSGADDEMVITAGDRLNGKPGVFQLKRCRGCGLMRLDPRPTRDTIHVYYPADYGPYRQTIVSDTERPDAGRPSRSRLTKLAGRVLPGMPEPLPPVQPGRLLEIGCASGSFLHGMAAAGWEVEGVEPDPMAAARARKLGYRVFAGPVEHAPDPSAPYDLVAGWMVLEHVHEPLAVLGKLHGWTRPGGWLALSIPDAGSLEFRLFGSRWFALQLPTHLHHFDRRTIRLVLERTGWSVERIAWQASATNLLKSLRYLFLDLDWPRGVRLMDDVLEGRRLRLLRRILARLFGVLRLSGRMIVWARRSDA